MGRFNNKATERTAVTLTAGSQFQCYWYFTLCSTRSSSICFNKSSCKKPICDKKYKHPNIFL